MTVYSFDSIKKFPLPKREHYFNDEDHKAAITRTYARRKHYDKLFKPTDAILHDDDEVVDPSALIKPADIPERKNLPPIRNRAVSVDGVIYNSCKEAAEALCITGASFNHRMYSQSAKFAGYKFINKDEGKGSE